MIDGKENEVTEDIGGVQGASADDTQETTPRPEVDTDQASDVIAPDAGEIEWAGSLVTKAPRGG